MFLWGGGFWNSGLETQRSLSQIVDSEYSQQLPYLESLSLVADCKKHAPHAMFYKGIKKGMTEAEVLDWMG